MRIPKNPYVYSLTDPMTGEVFYIGKGRNKRLFAHVIEAKKGYPGTKCERIRSIIKHGRSIQYAILGEYGTDLDAFEAEKYFIASHKGLTNIVSCGGGVKVKLQDTAKLLLDRMKTYEAWTSELSESTEQLVGNVFGSARQCYNYVKYNLTYIATMHEKRYE